MAEPYSPLLRQLIDALKCLPGVGQKSAQRMAFHLLQRNREGARILAGRLADAVGNIANCERCRMLTEDAVCGLCRSDRRDGRLLCVVEMPADVVAIEQAGIYNGRYFVLMGHLSPIDGVGPRELGLDQLEQILGAGAVAELVLATSVTVEGDATAHLLAQLARRHGVRASRIAYGVPVGGELEFIDSGTLSRAFTGRHEIEVAEEEVGL
jgi:recombination protein RecR